MSQALVPALILAPLARAAAQAQQGGSIRGSVVDKDFDLPLVGAQVLVVETGQRVETGDQGGFVLSDVPPGTYTLIVSKDGYVRLVKADVLVTAGRLTDLDAELAAEFTELDEFVVREVLALALGSELALLDLRSDAAALMDSIGSELMSRAGASDAAAALRLVAGASTQGGKSAVIRGLPDRFISSQMNGVRLPSADEDKRAVELDQFPSSVIESIQVAKTFTPDQQGDASGGAVNVKLKGVPSEAFFEVKGQLGANSSTFGEDFLTYDGGGVDFWGRDDGGRDPQLSKLGQHWDGAVGTRHGDDPTEYKFSTAFGGMQEVADGVRLGGSASLFYERDASSYDDGVDDSWWVTTPGAGMVPETNQGTPQDGDFKTALYDVTQSKQSVRWGGLGALGLESENHSVALTYLYTRVAEDTATLAVDTRGKEYFFPGYDPNDPQGTGNEPQNRFAAPYLRLETLDYNERTTQTLQLHGEHALPFAGWTLGDSVTFGKPELDWTLARSSADFHQPDKRQFGALWLAESYNPGFPPFVPPFTTPETWLPYKPGANFNLGNVQRIWKSIEEESDQAFTNLKFPFTQWSESQGYVKVGVFTDAVDRTFDQDSYSNFGDSGASYLGGFDDAWSEHFSEEDHPITDSTLDVDYEGNQDVDAWYAMLDLPLTTKVNVIGGARFESTRLGVTLDPEADAVWYPPSSGVPTQLNPGDADVDFSQDDVLPSLGLVYRPIEQITVRTSYSQTIARQTFKELTPVIQQEYLGGPIFIGNPDLEMADVANYDLRVDYTPREGALLSASLFRKDVDNSIEYVQRYGLFDYTTASNYPKGEMNGVELEARQDLGHLSKRFEGLSLGANATFISSEVTLPDDEAAGFSLPNIAAPMTSRDMTNAPEHLFNLYATYDVADWGTQIGLFWTLTGDTLVAGAAQSNGNFIPSVYATEYDTLNFSVSQKLGRFLSLQFQAKNLTNPEIQEVYRSEYIGDDVLKTSYTKGIDYSLSLTARFSF